jgi:hypothetical protein
METLQFYFSIISCSVLISIGIFGNIISIIIFKSKTFKNQSFSRYLACTCIINIIVLLYLPIMLMMSTIFIINSINCKLIVGIRVLITETQAWVLALCSLDRLISVVIPYKFQFKNKLNFQIGIISIVIIILALFLMPAAYYYETEINKYNQTECSLPLKHELAWVFLYFKIQYLLLRTVLPFLIMIITSVVIVLKISRTKRKLTTNKHQQRERQLAKSLVIMDIFFILFRLPMVFYLFINNSDNDEGLLNNFVFLIIQVACSGYSVFLFIIFIVFNKVYQSLFFKYLSFKCNVRV